MAGHLFAVGVSVEALGVRHKTLLHRAERVLLVVVVVLCLAHLLVLLFIDHGLGARGLWLPLWGMILSVLLTIYGCAYVRYREGLRVAKFFMIAMIPYIFFRFIFFLGLINVPSPFTLLPKSGFGLFMQNPNTAQAIGVACEAMIMALAVLRPLRRRLQTGQARAA